MISTINGGRKRIKYAAVTVGETTKFAALMEFATNSKKQGFISQVERSEKKVGNNKLVAAFPDDANVGQESGGRPVVIII